MLSTSRVTCWRMISATFGDTFMAAPPDWSDSDHLTALRSDNERDSIALRSVGALDVHFNEYTLSV